MSTPMPHSRRGFLATSAVLAAGWSPASRQSLFAAAEPEKGINKAVKIGMVRVEGSLLKKFQILKELGYDGVELDSPNDWQLDTVLNARDEAGLRIHGVVDSRHWQDTLSDPDPDVRSRGVEALKTALRDAKDYGADSVLLVPAKVTAQAIYDQAWERSQAEITKALPLAEELGIQILLENVWNDFLTSPQETARYIDELQSDLVGAYFDVGNAVRYSPPASWIPVLGKRIKKLDVKEYSLDRARQGGVYDGFKAPLLEGDCDWPAVMHELNQVGFAGWATAEISPQGDREWLADLASRMDRALSS